MSESLVVLFFGLTGHSPGKYAQSRTVGTQSWEKTMGKYQFIPRSPTSPLDRSCLGSQLNQSCGLGRGMLQCGVQLIHLWRPALDRTGTRLYSTDNIDVSKGWWQTGVGMEAWWLKVQTTLPETLSARPSYLLCLRRRNHMLLLPEAAPVNFQ